jgi:hypothetical protein
MVEAVGLVALLLQPVLAAAARGLQVLAVTLLARQ